MRRVVYREIKRPGRSRSSTPAPAAGFGRLLSMLGIASAELRRSRARLGR